MTFLQKEGKTTNVGVGQRKRRHSKQKRITNVLCERPPKRRLQRHFRSVKTGEPHAFTWTRDRLDLINFTVFPVNYEEYFGTSDFYLEIKRPIIIIESKICRATQKNRNVKRKVGREQVGRETLSPVSDISLVRRLDFESYRIIPVLNIYKPRVLAITFGTYIM